ncbi:MAG: RIP metalloprotease [Rickettsiales bacterium]|jgi:regulator of sigma E protease|nr:RIP metalloprotease [Rickettsiales bacterium]
MFVLTFFYNVIAFVFVISVLVFVHEIGHYLACLWFNVRVASFSIGMGKELWGRTNKRGERWKISLFPIGGYVMMYGDSDASSGSADKELLKNATEEEKKTIIYFQPKWKKFIIAFMGPFFNLVFAILLFTFIYNVRGISIIKPIVNDVLKDSPSYNILQKDDVIIEINGETINNFNQIKIQTSLSNGEPLNIKFLRNDVENTTIITPQKKVTEDVFGNQYEDFFIGVASSEVNYIKINIFQAFIESAKTAYNMCKNTLIILGQVITGRRGGDNFGGPLKIAKYSAQSFNGGIMLVIYFLAMLSVNLGFLNLLPIPVLDGGNLLFLLIEMIIRRNIPEKLQEKLLQVGFGILVFIMVFATFNDIKFFLQ